jgi:hypothetical protein
VATQTPPRKPSSGDPTVATGPRFDQVGLAVGMMGMFAGMLVAASKDSDIVTSAIAGVICVAVPIGFVWLLLWLLRGTR